MRNKYKKSRYQEALTLVRYVIISITMLISCSELEKSQISMSGSSALADSYEVWARSVSIKDCWLRKTPSISDNNLLLLVKKGTKFLSSNETPDFSSAYVNPEIGFISTLCFQKISR
jgi:hypothetical protein